MIGLSVQKALLEEAVTEHGLDMENGKIDFCPVRPRQLGPHHHGPRDRQVQGLRLCRVRRPQLCRQRHPEHGRRRRRWQAVEGQP